MPCTFCIYKPKVCDIIIEHGLLAQLGERLGHNQNVTGSSPVQTTKRKPHDFNVFSRLGHGAFYI